MPDADTSTSANNHPIGVLSPVFGDVSLLSVLVGVAFAVLFVLLLMLLFVLLPVLLLVPLSVPLLSIFFTVSL